MSDAVIVTKEDKIVRVVVNRPPVNALTIGIYEEIGDVFTTISTWRDVNVALLSAGEGVRAFCAGLDLNEFLAATVEDDPARANIVRYMFHAVRHCAVPVIGAIGGPALGAGAVLASVCDIRVASDKATFGMPEVNVGRCGGAAHMGRHMPQGLLRKMFFTGRPISAAEAYRVGFVQDLTTPEELMPTAEALAKEISVKAPLGLRYGKEALNLVEFMQVDAGYPVEQGFSTKLMMTEDAREATKAVVEKRPPVFVGR